MADTSVISSVRYCDVDPTVPPGIFGAVPNVLLYSTLTNKFYFWEGPADTGWRVLADPTMIGGGSSNSLIYRPGSGANGPGPVVFDSWTDLVTQLSDLRAAANGSGSYVIEFDDSIVSPAPIPVGAYDMTDVTWIGRMGTLTAVTIPEGVVFTGLRQLTSNLQITFTGATPPVSDFSGPFATFAIGRGAELICMGTGPFLQNSGTQLVVLLDDGKIQFGATQVIDIDTAAPGTGAVIIGFDSSELNPNTLSGIAGAQVQLSWEASSARLSEDQPAFTGPGGALSLKNDTCARKFPTAVITASQGIGSNDVARVDTTGGPVSITLPLAFDHRGLMPIVKDVGGAAATNPITILPTGADTIDGGASATITVDKGSMRFVSDGVSDWLIV